MLKIGKHRVFTDVPARLTGQVNEFFFFYKDTDLNSFCTYLLACFAVHINVLEVEFESILRLA